MYYYGCMKNDTKKWPETAEQWQDRFGAFSDAQIARARGVSRQRVHQRRTALGVPAYRAENLRHWIPRLDG